MCALVEEMSCWPISASAEMMREVCRLPGRNLHTSKIQLDHGSCRSSTRVLGLAPVLSLSDGESDGCYCIGDEQNDLKEHSYSYRGHGCGPN